MLDRDSPFEALAMYGGGGLVILGVVVIGIVEMALGSTHTVQSNGEVVHDALVSPTIRAYIIQLGLLIWAGYGVGRLVTGTPASAEETS